MKGITIYIFLLLLIAATAPLHSQQAVNDSMFQFNAMRSFKLIDAGKNKNTFIKENTAALIVFVFLSPECPLCKNYTPVLNNLQHQFGQPVIWLGIVPGKTYTAAAIQLFAKKYNVQFPLLIDPQKKLTNYLHGSVTPECVVLNHQYELVYKGAIDNRVKQLGVKRWQATENYLSDAISQYLQPAAVAVKRVKAIGCFINDF